MESQPRELRIYETAQEEVPFSTWMDGLKDRNARARINTRLKRVTLGNLGDHKFVGEGIFELRIDYGPGYRIYFAQTDKLTVLLLCGGDKSTQEQDILKAKQYWIDYRQRENAD